MLANLDPRFPRSYAVYSSLPVYAAYSFDDQIRAKFKILFDGYRNMFDQSFSKSKDLGGWSILHKVCYP